MNIHAILKYLQLVMNFLNAYYEKKISLSLLK